MTRQRQLRHEAKGVPRIPGGLIAENSRILYVPVTKVASTTVKRLLAQVEGTYLEPNFSFTPQSSAFAAEYVHSPQVHGLTKYRDLSLQQKQTVLTSDDWWRVAIVRDPYDRVVSTWQNRILMFGASLPAQIRKRLQFTFDAENRIDLTATFDNFAHALSDHQRTFFTDDHFRSQSKALRFPQIDFTHFIRLESKSQLTDLCRGINERAGTQHEVVPSNEGLGIQPAQVMTSEIAEIIEDVYADDFANLGYRRRDFPARVPPKSLSTEATRLALCLHDVVADRHSRRGVRYGFSQIRQSFIR